MAQRIEQFSYFNEADIAQNDPNFIPRTLRPRPTVIRPFRDSTRRMQKAKKDSLAPQAYASVVAEVLPGDRTVPAVVEMTETAIAGENSQNLSVSASLGETFAGIEPTETKILFARTPRDTDERATDPLSIYLNEIRQYPNLRQHQILPVLQYIRTKDALEKSGQDGSHIMNTMAQDVSLTEGYPKDYQDVFKRTLKGSKDPREFLVKCYAGVVVSEAKKMRYPGLTMMDFIQEGNIALLKAINGYDLDRADEATFYTFARDAIHNEMIAAISNIGKLIRIPEVLDGHVMKARKIIGQYQATFGEKPSQATLYHLLKNKTNWKQHEIELALETMESQTTRAVESLEKPLSSDDERTVGDTITASIAGPEKLTVDPLVRHDCIETIKEVTQDFPSHIRWALTEIYSLNDSPSEVAVKNLTKLAQEREVTRAAVSLWHRKGIKALQADSRITAFAKDLEI